MEDGQVSSGKQGSVLIGVLALQGDFAEHISSLRRVGVRTKEIRNVEDLDGIDGLVLPGGESTTIGKLLVDLQMMEPLRNAIVEGAPVFGTCAGSILLARDIVEYPNQPRLGTMDMIVDRNFYGSQVYSFEASIQSNAEAFREGSLRAVLIRAPAIVEVGPAVSVLAKFQDKPVLVQQKNMLATTFHPELTGDLRIHQYFVDMVLESRPR
eukprot:CAMPEP_0184687858 /NCGR_PEP_ID=MMETSP0312-20130426/27761_1 /TAXON_ID=31354 /ORGANISM="Compsopogon coeruleus, Strain SAG 36.94" /LENGTH=209 /DNA_ID=CAMNT_0027144409 /DNA_START=40 /DNA_END=669 /DNA_ORIENTATION=+